MVGQDGAVSLFRRALQSGELAHAYLVTGPAHVGKMTLALDLARAVNCAGPQPPCGECTACRKIASANHPDVQVIGLPPPSEEVKRPTEIATTQ
ncbi:MAG: DNA polymerase III subunit delta', partial [Dehalococcoidales bacterium]|nr:DNA polymerase III subunit delta' [Dehalococcoidales bacterium]